MNQFDLAIVGGGMSGVTAALSYAQLGLKVALIEATVPQMANSTSFDQRAIALSAASVKIFTSLGLWDLLAPLACPIEQIHVSEQGQFGFTRLYAKDYLLSALGEVISLDVAGPLLWEKAQQQPLIKCYCPALLDSFEVTHSVAHLKLKTESGAIEQITAKLIIAADGTFSKVAQLAGIETTRNAYPQHAVIANIATEKPHLNRAFERFTKNGPLALLPLVHNQSSLVWCHHPDEIESIKRLDDQAFMRKLQGEFGYRLGKIIKVSQRFHYPLSLHLAAQPYSGRVFLLGNSAHTLHPIAGQGFNLGLRDIAVLNDCLAHSIAHQQDFGELVFLQNFAASRQADWRQTIVATDTLCRLFSNPFWPLKCLRSTTMNVINQLPLLKNKVANSAMGYDGQSSRLARGLTNKRLLAGSANEH